jgi:hypothetical protein
MYKNILIEYLFLINLIKSEIILDNKLFYNLEGIYNEILIKELNYCENEIINFINFYTNFNLDFEYNQNFDLYFKNQNIEKKTLKNQCFLFNNEIFFFKNISLLNNNIYNLDNLIEKKNNYQFNNNFIIKNLNNKYYLNFFKNNYFNITNTINFIFNIDLITLIENKKNINIVSNFNLTNLNSYKNINKNLLNMFNPIKQNNNKTFLKFYKNINYFEYLNINNKNKDLDLVKNHFFIINNLYNSEYNFKILLNFFKTDNYKEFYFKLPINYATSNICTNLVKSYYNYAPSVDHYLNNLLYDKIIYNQKGTNIKDSFIFIKKRIDYTPLFFNYKFKNKFNYFANKKYNLTINELKNYNLDYFSVSKTKKMHETPLDLNYFYYSRSNTKIEISKASTFIQYNLPRIRPFIMRSNEKRQFMYDNNILRLLKSNSEYIELPHRIFYNHYLYGFFKGGVDSLINFTQIDMFHNNCDMFFFKGDTFNKQHHFIANLNKVASVKKTNNALTVDFAWESKVNNEAFFRNNLIYEKTKYERALNLMFNFNEELKPNNTVREYLSNLLFGFIKDNNITYVTFKDHYNKNNFICKHILYRVNNLNYNKTLKYNIFYTEFLNSTNKKYWEKPFFFEKIKNIPSYLHTKNNYIYPNYKVWPISEDFIFKPYVKQGFGLNYRQVLLFYRFISDDIISYSRFLKTGQLSQSIQNRYYNFIPFLAYINNFDFIKKSNNYIKRNDFISFIPKFKILSLKFFDSLENFKYFEKLNSILIKFNNNLYNNNTQKIDQSLYNLNIFNNSKIINYIPDSFYEKYATLEWNNQSFFSILNRKLFYKHLISFGDLSNKFIQNLIYEYSKTIFFEEKLRNIFFNRNIFKYKNFENLDDFIKFKVNNLNVENKTFIFNKNKNFNLLKDYKNMIKILINPYLHIKKHYHIYYVGQLQKKTIAWYLSDYAFAKNFYDYMVREKEDILFVENVLKNENLDPEYILNFENKLREYEYSDTSYKSYFKNFLALKEHIHGMPNDIFLNTSLNELTANYIRKRYSFRNADYFKNYILEEKVPEMFLLKDKGIYEKIFHLEYIRTPFRNFYLFLRLHIFSTSFSPRCLDLEETSRFHSKSSRSHINSYKFFTYQIPSNYVNYILSHKFNSLIIFDKIFSLLLISKLKILSNFQKLDNIFNLDINFNFFKFFSYKTKINDINLIKKKSFINFKLYKNNLIEEAGFYNINILENDRLHLKDEDFFLLYNRKRLDNESIYKSWHSTKFLNKKINYHFKSNIFDYEDKLNFFYNSKIFNILRYKDLSYLYKLNYLTTSFLNFFTTDVNFNRNVFHTISGSFFTRNLNFIYPQNNVKNINIFSFITHLKDSIGYSEYNRYLNGTFKKHFLNKKVDLINHYWEFESTDRKVGVYKYGFKKHARYGIALKGYMRRYPEFEQEFTFFKLEDFKSNIINKKILTKKAQYHNIYRFLSYFQYYGDTRFPKNKNNFKKLNFIFNIYNFQSYFINDRYAFENKNLMSIQQFYNHRTTSDYLRNLIDYKKKDMSKDFYKSINNNKINDFKMISPYYNLYNLYTPTKIWEIKLSNKLFPYFYSKNLNSNYKIVQYSRLNKVYNNLYMKRSTRIYRKKNNLKFFEYFRYYIFELSIKKFLNFENKKNSFEMFYNNFFQNTKKENQLKRKFYINTIGNLIDIEYKFNNYISKKDFLLKNKEYVNIFNFKINNENFSYSQIYNIKNILPNHLNYKLFFDVYKFDKKNFIVQSIKFLNYCINSNFYVKIPYISELYSKNLYDFFNEKNIRWFKLRTLRYSDNLLGEGFILEMFTKRPFLKLKPRCDLMIEPHNIFLSFKNYKNNELNFNFKMFKDNFIFNFYNLNLDLEEKHFFFKFVIKENLNCKAYLNIYYGNKKYLNNNFKFIKENNNYFFFSKNFEFNKYILIHKNNYYFYSFFNPYDFYIFRYKGSFTSLNNVYYKTNSNLNLRNFINNLFKTKEYKSKNFDLFYDLLDRNLWPLFDEELSIFYRKKPIHYNNIFKFNDIFKKNSFTLKYYENISNFNKKKIEELSFFGFLLKNNVLLGIFEYNNMFNLAYNLKFEKFYLNNNEANLYSIDKILNSIFILKNKYIWLIFFYYNNFFYFLFNANKVLEDFLWEPVNFWSYYFYFQIPIIFSVEYNSLFLDITLNIYNIFIQILIIFYAWLCVSGEGLINLKDYIIFSHNQIDWNLLYEKYNIYPCDLYGRSLVEMKISRFVFMIFFLSYFVIYIKILFFFFNSLSKIYNSFLLNYKRKINYYSINNKFDLEINNKIHHYYLHYNNFVKTFNQSKNNFEIVFFFKSKHSYKYYRSKFKCKLKIPYFLDEASLRRINKLKILTNFETHYYILDLDLKKFRTTLSFLNSSYALFTKTRTIEIGNLLIKGNIKRILYIHQLGNLITYDPILGNYLIPNSITNLEKKDIYFIDKIFLNNQLKIFNLMPLSEDDNYIYLPKFIFKNILKYKFKYINVYYTYNFLFFFIFDSLLTIEGTLFRISNPNFFKPLIFFNQNISLRSFSFFI